MQTVTDKAEVSVFLKNMSQSFTDMFSWQGWYAFQFTAEKPLTWGQQSKVTSLIRTLFPEHEGSILWTDGSVLCVMHIKEEFDLISFAESLYELDTSPKISVRMLSIQNERDELLSIITPAPVNTERFQPTTQASYRGLRNLLPDIDALLRQWHTIKQRRKERAKPLILVVDDDKMLVLLVQHMLEKNYTVITAHSGREAIEKHLQEAPDVVFLDIGLPDCNGMTILNYIHQFDQDSQIVIFTADTYLKTKVNALAGGADGFVPKPITRETLENYITRWSQPAEEERKTS